MKRCEHVHGDRRSFATGTWALASVTTLCLLAARPARSGEARNLVENAGFEQPGASRTQAAGFDLRGDASRKFAGMAYEFSSMGIALDSGRDTSEDGRLEGSVSRLVAISPSDSLPGRWYRFKIRGLPEDGFAVANDDLYLKADFLGDGGKKALDGVTRKIYGFIEQERRDLTANGVRHRNGAETWRTYAFEFRLPFPEIDKIRIGVGFRNGQGRARDGSFFVDDFSLEAIPTPSAVSDDPRPRPAVPSPVDRAKLVPLGGRWSYLPAPGDGAARGASPTFTDGNASRLFFKETDSRYFNPFAENMTAWLRSGYLDLRGNLVRKDQLRTDNVTIRFDSSSMIVRAHNLPNHPTTKYQGPGTIGGNPSYIQEYDSIYYLPLNPQPNPNAIAMDLRNTNRALNMGPIGVAVNGVVFFNPFDMGMTDATDLMDRCCGHPNPDNMYHYHKYPVCVRSSFADEGSEHSPVIGWAFDGFPIHGPYESSGVMAKDSTENPLNAFNVHRDQERGWHYHVTPGKFPYIIGGYWGEVDSRNLHFGPRGGRGPGRRRGPRGFPGGGPGGPGGPGFGGFPPPPREGPEEPPF